MEEFFENLFKKKKNTGFIDDLLIYVHFAFPGSYCRQMAAEVVRSRMHKLPQILQQKRRVELRYHHVGGLFLRRETLQGKTDFWRAEGQLNFGF